MIHLFKCVEDFDYISIRKNVKRSSLLAAHLNVIVIVLDGIGNLA